MSKLDNLFKSFKTIISLLALTLIIYGFFTIIMPDKFKKNNTKKEKKDTKVEFKYNDKVKYLNNLYLGENNLDDNQIILKIAANQIQDSDLEKVSDFDYQVEGYYFNHKKISGSNLDKYLKKIFNDIEYQKVDFSTKPDNYFYYNLEDDSFYLYERLVEYLDCKNNFNFIEDDLVIKDEFVCSDDLKYDLYFSYKYNKEKKDYYISDIELIGE